MTRNRKPRFPGTEEPDARAARSTTGRSARGRDLLCHGGAVFEDTGGQRPEGRRIAPARGSSTDQA
ncbi:DUF5999 family protein [Streptomyces sp. BE20]|uniref:DUF5999 family protein n=1 Tax=Streptomyces sp. BE20 TaxID=3002525 RepID=UPI002E798613|nr:DUF5999 family protein [Streptomyces sp. BE20]MED7950201.1 DUF5999 family protein [Streptomyces sp. BE303]MEE1822172.1 DUF5999 family protein [Streptomyces sp. BE20]